MSNIVKAGPNTANYPTDAMNTDEVKAWIAGSAAAKALSETVLLYQNFLHGQWTSWLASYEASRVDEPAPAPPNGLDAAMDPSGFSFTLVDSGTPSGPPPTFTKKVVTPSSGSIRSGVSPNGGLLFAPVGGVVTQVDGTKWQRLA